MNHEITITLGTWQYYFRDRQTKEKLTTITGVYSWTETNVTVPVPPELENNPNAELYYERIK